MWKSFYSSKSSSKGSTPKAGDSSEDSSSHGSPAFSQSVNRPGTSPAFGHPAGAFDHPVNTSTGFVAEDLYPEAAHAGHQRSMSFSSARPYPPSHGISDDGIYVAQPRQSRSTPNASQPAAPPQAPPFSIPRQQQQQKQESASAPPQAKLEKEMSREPERGGSSNGSTYSRQSNGSMQSAPVSAQSVPPRPVRRKSDVQKHDRASAEASVEEVPAKQSAQLQEDLLSNAVPPRSSGQLKEDLLTRTERVSASVKKEADLLPERAPSKSAGEVGQKCGHCGSNFGPDGQAIDDSWADDAMATAGALFFCGWIKKMSTRAVSNALNRKVGEGLQGGLGSSSPVQQENAEEGVAGKAQHGKQTPVQKPPARRQSRPRRESIDLNSEINAVQAEEALYRLVPRLYRHWQAGELTPPPQAAPSTTPDPPPWPASADPFDDPESFGGSPFSAAKHQNFATAKQTPNTAASQDTPTPPASRRPSQAESGKPRASQPGEDSLSPSEFEELMKQYGPELQAAGLTGSESQRRPSFSSSPVRTAPAKAQDNPGRSDPRAPETPDQQPSSSPPTPPPPAAAPKDPPPDPPKPAAPGPSSAPHSRTPSPLSSPPRDPTPEATVDDLLRAFGSALPPDPRKPPQQEVPKPAPPPVYNSPPPFSSAYSTAYASAKREVPRAAAQRPPPPPPPPAAPPQGPSAGAGVEELMRGLSGAGPKAAPPGGVPASSSVPQTPKRTPETTPRPSTGADAPAGGGGARVGSAGVSGGVPPAPAVDVDELLRHFPDAAPHQQKPTSRRTPPPPPPPQAAAAPPPIRDPFGDSGSPFRANSSGFGPSSRQSSGGLNEESANFFGMNRTGSSGSSTSGRAPSPPQPPPVAAGVAPPAPRIPEEQLVAYIRQWATGKEGNLRALLATLQFVLWKECRWRQVDIQNLVEGTAVKKAYQRAILCVHPDKVHGDTPEHKLIAKHVFNYLKESYNRFSSEELF